MCSVNALGTVEVPIRALGWTDSMIPRRSVSLSDHSSWGLAKDVWAAVRGVPVVRRPGLSISLGKVRSDRNKELQAGATHGTRVGDGSPDLFRCFCLVDFPFRRNGITNLVGDANTRSTGTKDYQPEVAKTLTTDV